MIKKAFLALATLSLTVVAYYALSRGDQPNDAAPDVADSQIGSIPFTNSVGGKTIATEIGDISGGGKTIAVIYDDLTGRPRYRFGAEVWEPVSSNKFKLEDLEIQIYTPRGQITYIRADDAEVTLAGSARNNPDLKRGTLHGNVRVTIDRTTTEWRDAHPEQAERDAHPDALIHITLDDARFDMERAELTSDGPLVVDSKEARIDRVTGLTLQWNQINNRIDSLRFRHGGRMELRRGGRAQRNPEAAERGPRALDRGEIYLYNCTNEQAYARHRRSVLLPAPGRAPLARVDQGPRRPDPDHAADPPLGLPPPLHRQRDRLLLRRGSLGGLAASGHVA